MKNNEVRKSSRKYGNLICDRSNSQIDGESMDYLKTGEGQLIINTERYETGILPHIIYKNKF